MNLYAVAGASWYLPHRLSWKWLEMQECTQALGKSQIWQLQQQPIFLPFAPLSLRLGPGAVVPIVISVLCHPLSPCPPVYALEQGFKLFGSVVGREGRSPPAARWAGKGVPQRPIDDRAGGSLAANRRASHQHPSTPRGVRTPCWKLLP